MRAADGRTAIRGAARVYHGGFRDARNLDQRVREIIPCIWLISLPT